MKNVFDALLAHIDREKACVLVSAVGGEGSAPRKTQSHMLVNACGRVCGTVGGGAVEGRSIEHALSLIAMHKSDMQTFELYEHAANDIGMICGGRVNVHFQYITPHDGIRETIQTAVRAMEEGSDAWLLMDITRHALTLYTGEKQMGISVPQEVLDRLCATSVICPLDGIEYYAEQVSYRDRVYIFGGGHVAQALVPVLHAVDFRCVIVEDREEFCRKELFPHAQEILLLEEKDWNRLLHIGENDCICIMTRGHKNDLACQAFALETKAGYIGVIGSRRKIASVNAQLRSMGYSDAQIARIVTPIGLDIGAVTPAEIAVSIAAQMIAHRAASRKEHIKKSCMA